jgi:hypothetical protein
MADAGVILEQGSPTQLLSQPRERQTEQLEDRRGPAALTIRREKGEGPAGVPQTSPELPGV